MTEPLTVNTESSAPLSSFSRYTYKISAWSSQKPRCNYSMHRRFPSRIYSRCYFAKNGSDDLQATTRPPNLPTPRTLPQSLPSTRTVAQASSLVRFFCLVLACSLTPSSPPSICVGSSSGFVNPCHLLSILHAAVCTPMRNSP